MTDSLTVLTYEVGPLSNNTYVVVCESVREAVVIDPSFDSRPIWDDIERNGWKVTAVLNTHAHIDHVVENVYFMDKSGAGLAMHSDDLSLLHNMEMQAAWMGIEPPQVSEPTRLLREGDTIEVGSGELKIVHTPGHSPGSVSFIGPDFVISGDALFAGSIGRTDLPGGNYDQLIDAIRSKLFVLPDDTTVYPGHGPATTIGRERTTNPFLT